MIHEFKAQITEHDITGFTARIVPFNAPTKYGRSEVMFTAGGITVGADPVPVTIDHGDDVLDRVGVMDKSFNGADGMYGSFTFADTVNGRDVAELVKLGAVKEVSMGIEHDEPFNGGEMTGRLDHVTLTPHARFGRSASPSKVLSTHDEKEPEVADVQEVTAPVVTYDDSELKKAVAEMADKIDTFETKVVDEPALFSSVGDFVKTETLAAHDNAEALDKLAKFALSGETTTTAAGVVPDYLASEVLSIIATSRAFLGNIPSDPIGDAGMSVIYPNVTGKGSVAKQATEITEVASAQWRSRRQRSQRSLPALLRWLRSPLTCSHMPGRIT